MKCPICFSNRLMRYGWKAKEGVRVQRYQCLDCLKYTVSPILDDGELPEIVKDTNSPESCGIIKQGHTLYVSIPEKYSKRLGLLPGDILLGAVGDEGVTYKVE